MNPVILFRPNTYDDPELKVAAEYAPVITQRAQIARDQLVIGRYSVLPFYRELETDVTLLGGRLINSFAEHEYVADLLCWYEDLHGLTPQTWERVQDIPDEGPFILKGETNSRKQKWRTHMFAENKREAVEVMLRLKDDPLFEKQNIYVRKFEPLKNLGQDLSGMPVSFEYRFFTYRGKVLSSGFYWSSHLNEDGSVFGVYPQATTIPPAFVEKVLEKIADRCPFVVVDIALKENGEPIVVELNDGQMSGLSENDPHVLYKGLRDALRGP